MKAGQFGGGVGVGGVDFEGGLAVECDFLGAIVERFKMFGDDWILGSNVISFILRCLFVDAPSAES